jgi:polysaccharide export outer membrane protein
MSENEKNRQQGHRRIGSEPMKWLQVGVLVLLSASAVAQDAQNKQEVQGQTASTPAQTGNSEATASTGSSSAQTNQAGVPSAPKGAANVDSARYVIGPDDSLAITVWKEPSLSGTIPVRPDGMISMPLIGDLHAASRTPMQLSDDITQKLKKYIQDPNVSVVVMADSSQRIFLIGEVGHVGPVAMTPGMSPLQAIAAGGGLSAFANSKKIYILRNEGGKQQKIPFNYKKALKGEDAQEVTLKPGDTIVVP